jgi:hypothetical protein
MITRFNNIPRLLLIVAALGVLLGTAASVGAQPIKTTVPVSTRVANIKETCEDLGGKFTMVDGLSNGNEPLTITECDYGGGHGLSCHTEHRGGRSWAGGNDRPADSRSNIDRDQARAGPDDDPGGRSTWLTRLDDVLLETVSRSTCAGCRTCPRALLRVRPSRGPE